MSMRGVAADLYLARLLKSQISDLQSVGVISDNSSEETYKCLHRALIEALDHLAEEHLQLADSLSEMIIPERRAPKSA